MSNQTYFDLLFLNDDKKFWHKPNKNKTFLLTSSNKRKRTLTYDYSPPPLPSLLPPLFKIDPKTPYHIKRRLIEAKNTDDLGKYYYVPTDQPWLEELVIKQEASLSTGKYTQREIASIEAYTLFGDRLVNNMLRGEVDKNISDLMDTIYDRNIIPFKWQIYDFYEYLASKNLKLPPKSDIYIPYIDYIKKMPDYDPNSDTLLNKNLKNHIKQSESYILDDVAINTILYNNKEFFLVFKNIEPLIYALFGHLISAFFKAPRARGPIKVYRGVASEHYDTLNYTTNDLLSTTANPYLALEFANRSTKQYIDEPTLYACVYEIIVQPGVPVLYLQPFSKSTPPEVEILLPPCVMIRSSDEIRFKKIIPQDTLLKSMKKEFGLKSGYVFTIDITIERFTYDNPFIQRLLTERLEKKNTRARRLAAAAARKERIVLGEELSKSSRRHKRSYRSLSSRPNTSHIRRKTRKATYHRSRDKRTGTVTESAYADANENINNE